MRILFITNFMDVGGIETSLIQLTPELKRRGHDVTVLSSGGVLEGELEQRQVPHVRMSVNLWHPFQLIQTAFSLRDYLRRERFDIVHSMSAAGNLATLLSRNSAGTGTHFVSSPMGLQNSEHEFPVVTYLRNWFLTIRAERVLLISEAIEDAVSVLNIDSSRLVFCNVNGIDVNKLRPLPGEREDVRREFRIGDDEAVITTIGALHPRKSHDLFLEAAREVLATIPRARFLVVGEGPLLTKLQEQAARLGIDKQVIFTGRRRDIRAILAATDIYVKPGVVEGFMGITVLEAMCAERPVIAWTTRDVMASVIPDKTGILVPPKDPNDLAKVIITLFADEQLRARLVSQAAALVVERFGISQVAANLESVYLNTLGTRASV